MMFADKQPGIAASNRSPTNVIIDNRDITAAEIGRPAKRRRRQIQCKMAERNQVGRNHHIRGRLDRGGGSGFVKHF